MHIKRLVQKCNSGFTLVELIIVIAIIAVLTAVAAPQYIKYVERSRVSADMDTASTIQSVIIVLCTDGTITTDNDAYVTWNTTTGTGLTGDGKDVIEAVTGPIPAAKSSKARAADVVYSIDFTPEGTPIVNPSVDYTTWDEEN